MMGYKVLKSILVTLFIFSTFLIFAGPPIPTLNFSIHSLNTPVIVGQDVYFESIIDNTCSNGEFSVYFGPYASQPFFNFTFAGNISESVIIGPVSFNMPAMFNVTQTPTLIGINSINGCTIYPAGRDINSTDFDLSTKVSIHVLSDIKIPTLSQWGLIIVAFFLMIFGVVSLKRRSTEQVKLS
jgi:hypothetical protein